MATVANETKKKVTDKVRDKVEKAADKVEQKLADVNPTHKEGKVASAIEEQTAKLPSDVFLWAAIGSMAVSLTFKSLNKNALALFVGQWAPSFLLFGIYNKLVKQQGHD